MNLERFQEVLQIAIDDIAESKLIPKLQSLETSFSQSISQPANTAFAETFTQTMGTVETALLASTVNRFTQGQVVALSKVDGVGKTGQGLLARITEIFYSEGNVAGTKLARFQALRAEVAEFFATISAVNQNLEKLGLNVVPLADGEFEIDVYVPTELIGDNLDSFQKELRNFNIHLKTLSQIVSGNGAPLKLRGIGTGSLDFGILGDVAKAWAIFKLFKAIIEVYNGVLDVRLKHRQLAEPASVKVPDKIIEEIREFIKGVVDVELAKVHKQFMKDFDKSPDEHTKHQMEVALKLAIEFFADRLDRGARVDVILPNGLLHEGQAADGVEAVADSRYITMKAEVPKLRNLEFTERGILGLTERVELSLEKVAKKEGRKQRKAKKLLPKS